MANNLPSLTYFYKEDNLHDIEEKNYEEAWELLSVDENTKLITKDEVMKIKIPNNNATYVLTVFSGDVFDHLRSIKARILSSHCLLHSHRSNKRLPRPKVCPLYSVSMSNLVICCTNIEKNIRQEIYDKVEMMNGKTSRIFTNDVTHLITTEVGSAKYHAAGDMKKTIMLPNWVIDIWKMTVEHDLNASDESLISKYRCPIFNKYIICASGFAADTKVQLKKMIETEGGVYQGDLVCGKTTHLVINEAKGEKYNYAKLWKISIVNSKWVFDSVEANYCLPEKAYHLEPTASTSTPTNNKSLLSSSIKSSSRGNSRKLDIDISMIANTTTKNTVNETDARLNSSVNTTDNTMSLTTLGAAASLTKYSDCLKELNSIGKIKSVLFDGCGIYCDGFHANINEKLKKLFNSGGAIRFEDFNSDVTHVIVNQVNEKKCKNYVDTNPEVNILSIDWVIDTCRQNEIADCKNYCVFKNALNSVKTPKKRVREESNTKSLANQSVNISIKSYENDLNNYLSQYLTKEGDCAVPAPATEKQQHRTVLQETDLNQLSHQQSTASNNSSLQLINAEKAIAQRLLFSSKTFSIFGFDIDEVAELRTLIESMGGLVNDFNEEEADADDSEYFLNKPADYLLFPMTVSEPINASTTATVFWLRKCIEHNTIFALNEHVLYQPIPRFNTDRALTGCVVTISGYLSFEKETISNLCQLIGAITQSSFSSKTAKNIYPNSHLLCKTADGPKYQAAKSWKIPAVTLEWLIDSCVSGVKADESKYSIDLGDKQEEFIRNLDRIRRNFSDSQQNQTETMNTSETIAVAPGSSSSYTMHGDFESPETNKPANDSSLLDYSSSKKPRLDAEFTPPTVVKAAKQQQKDNENEIVSFKSPVVNNNVFKTPQPINEVAKKGLTKTPVLSTPPCNPRLQMLKQAEVGTSGSDGGYATPQSSNTTMNETSNDWQTPLWAKSPNDPEVQNFEARIKMNVDIDKVIEATRTPNPNGGPPLTPVHIKIAKSLRQANENAKIPGFFDCSSDFKQQNFEARIKMNVDIDKVIETTRTQNPNGGPPLTPVHVKIAKSLRQANVNAKIPGFYDCSSDSPEIVYSYELKMRQQKAETAAANQLNDDDNNGIAAAAALEGGKELKEVLKNLKIFVSKKLAKSTTELNSIVDALGADFLWIYNQSCTHVVYAGKANDNNKELRSAREQNKYIVSPHWLYACHEQRKRVDEALYPYTYNPSKCAVVTACTPKVSLGGGNNNENKLMPSTPIEVKASQQQQPSRSQAKKTTAQNIIKNYCSDESDGDDDDEDLAATNQANFRLLRKKPAVAATVNDDTEHDSEMNLLDSELLRNLDKQCTNNPPLADIPDSIDIKNNFLNQLQDTLAKVGGACGVGSTTVTTTPNVNLNTSQSSLLNEHQIMNELNKSGRSKWGNTLLTSDADMGGKSVSENNNDDDLLCVRILDDNNSRDSAQQSGDDDIDRLNLKQLNINRKYGFNSNNNKSDLKKRRQQLQNNDDDDDEFNNANAQNHHVAPSQVQVTLWKEEQQNHHHQQQQHQQQQTLRRKNENISERFTNYYKN